MEPHDDNIGYLRTKQAKLGHLLSGLDPGRRSVSGTGES
jgi:hypothetical protein